MSEPKSNAAGPSSTPPPLLNGLLILHSRSGNLIYSQRIAPAFGLTSCAQLARDELRLGAMLFAIHLNATATAAAGESGAAGLTAYQLDGVTVRFCVSTQHELLLVLFAPASLGGRASGFLASEVLRRFESCFAAPLKSQQPVRHGALKRSAFASSLRDAVASLHTWCLNRLLEEVGESIGVLPPPPSASTSESGFASYQALTAAPTVELRGVASLHSHEICDALSRAPGEAASAAAVSAPVSKPMKSSSRSRTAPSVGGSSNALPLLSILGLGDDGRHTAHSDRAKPGIFSLCCPGHATIKPKPITQQSSEEALPLLFWRSQGGESDEKEEVMAATVRIARLHELVKELQAAWRLRGLKPANALYTSPRTPSLPDWRFDGTPTSSSAKSDAEDGSFAVVLIRAPMVLRLRVGLLQQRKGAEVMHAIDQAWLTAVVGALAMGVQPWMAPLERSLAFLGGVK